MAHDVYYHFPQTPQQARRVGARGGKATARNRRAHSDSASAEAREAEVEVAPQFPLETTATAIARLDAQCPWLRGAEKRWSQRAQRPGLVTPFSARTN